MATAAAKVVNRLAEAKESRHLDLVACDLTQIPVAVYVMLAATPPASCDFSRNQLRKLPVKLCNKFPALQEFLVRENRLIGIPDEVHQLTALRVLDLTTNVISCLPQCIYTLPCLQRLLLDNNNITDVDVDMLLGMASLRTLSLRNNPLRDDVTTRLRQCARFTVEL